nr:PHB depolymerase family esterase [Sinorhizobium meliloti]
MTKESSVRSLSATLRRLNRLSETDASRFRSARLKPLEGFGSNPGQLRAWSHVPVEVGRSPALVVVLHGCTQTAALFDACSGWSRLADDNGFVVLFPEQLRSNNANLCFNWFNPVDIRRNSGEALSIRQMVEHMIKRHSVNPSRVFITGLSAGGAMVNAMLAAYPEVFSAGTILSGLPYKAASTVPEALDRMRGHGLPDGQTLRTKLRNASDHQGPWPTVSIWHGAKDDTVVPANARAIVEQWRGVHGVGRQPTVTQQRGGGSLDIWKDASGRDVIELYTLPGMAHGVAIDTSAGYEMSGRFFLDVGLSSTIETALAWGLIKTPIERRIKTPSRTPDGISAVIERALRAAGFISSK